jgi:ribose/xylose/arabinose/galactoside ABC-type transport system permease subunit
MSNFLRRVVTSEYIVFILTSVYVIALWPFAPEIVSTATLQEILTSMMPLLILAVGQTFVMLVAGIDLSITSVLALASVVAASIMTQDGGFLAGSLLAVPCAYLAFLFVGLIVGASNGLFVTVLGMPSFMVTLVSQSFLSGLAIWYTSFRSTSVSIGHLPGMFTFVGRGSVAGVPIAFLLAIFVTAGGYWLMQRTIFGRWLYAIGNNSRAALVSGVPVKRMIFSAFVLSAVCSALASIIYTGRLETGTPVLGQRLLLDVIGAAVIGGVSLFGGKAKILWVVFGVLFLTTVDKGLQLLGVTQFIVFAVKGSVILFAATIDAIRNRFSFTGAQ